MRDALTHGLTLTLIGMGVVFAVLALIAAIVALLRRVDGRWRRAEEGRRDAALGAPPRIDALTAVIIAAAVATYVAGRFRIRAVRRLNVNGPGQGSTWSAHGRAVLLGSHVIVRRPPE